MEQMNKPRVHLTPETRKNIAEWLVCCIEDKGRIHDFFQESEPELDEYPPKGDPYCPHSRAWLSMMWNITKTDDGDDTEMLRALRKLMCAVEVELCQASKEFLYSAYEHYHDPNAEYADV